MEKFFKRQELIGKMVVDQEAAVIGKIADLALGKDGKMGLLLKGETTEEVVIVLDDIKKIDDVVLLKSVFSAKTEESTPVPPLPEPKKTRARTESQKEKLCPNCSGMNRPKAKFCVKCGQPL